MLVRHPGSTNIVANVRPDFRLRLALRLGSTVTCEYCKSAVLEGDLKCANCGAPIGPNSTTLPDFRTCPTCSRKLLALGSPACSYCGHRLPDEYIRVREADLRRLAEVEDVHSVDRVSGVSQFFSERGRHKRNGSQSALDGTDILSLIDFFT